MRWACGSSPRASSSGSTWATRSGRPSPSSSGTSPAQWRELDKKVADGYPPREIPFTPEAGRCRDDHPALSASTNTLDMLNLLADVRDELWVRVEALLAGFFTTKSN